MHLLLLNRAQVDALLDQDQLIEGLIQGFKALSAGQVEAPGRTQVSSGQGYLLSMPAGMSGKAMGVKLVSVFHGNHQLGLPGHQALVTLFDAENGRPLALLDGTHITALRTAAASALASRLLMRTDARILTIIGAGVQGQAHLRMLSHAHDFNEIRIASYHPADAEKLASANSRARAFGTFSEAVDGADVVCLCTSSATPVVQVGWLKPGCHVNSVGYAPPGGELPRDLVLSSRLVVETRMAFTAPPVGCAELSGLDAGLACELGEILAGKCPGRRDDAEITVYKAMGHAMEDLVAANIVYQNARARGVGQIVEL